MSELLLIVTAELYGINESQNTAANTVTNAAAAAATTTRTTTTTGAEPAATAERHR